MRVLYSLAVAVFLPWIERCVAACVNWIVGVCHSIDCLSHHHVFLHDIVATFSHFILDFSFFTFSDQSCSFPPHSCQEIFMSSETRKRSKTCGAD